MMICVGLTLTIHFCGGMLAGVSAIPQNQISEETTVVEACCIAKTETNKACCNDAVIDLSEVADETVLDASDISKQFIAILPKTLIIAFKKANFTNKITLPNYTFQGNAPPLYKLYSSYIFYA